MLPWTMGGNHDHDGAVTRKTNEVGSLIVRVKEKQGDRKKRVMKRKFEAESRKAGTDRESDVNRLSSSKARLNEKVGGELFTVFGLLATQGVKSVLPRRAFV